MTSDIARLRLLREEGVSAYRRLTEEAVEAYEAKVEEASEVSQASSMIASEAVLLRQKMEEREAYSAPLTLPTPSEPVYTTTVTPPSPPSEGGREAGEAPPILREMVEAEAPLFKQRMGTGRRVVEYGPAYKPEWIQRVEAVTPQQVEAQLPAPKSLEQVVVELRGEERQAPQAPPPPQTYTDIARTVFAPVIQFFEPIYKWVDEGVKLLQKAASPQGLADLFGFKSQASIQYGPLPTPETEAQRLAELQARSLGGMAKGYVSFFDPSSYALAVAAIADIATKPEVRERIARSFAADPGLAAEVAGRVMGGMMAGLHVSTLISKIRGVRVARAEPEEEPMVGELKVSERVGVDQRFTVEQKDVYGFAAAKRETEVIRLPRFKEYESVTEHLGFWGDEMVASVKVKGVASIHGKFTPIEEARHVSFEKLTWIPDYELGAMHAEPAVRLQASVTREPFKAGFSISIADAEKGVLKAVRHASAHPVGPGWYGQTAVLPGEGVGGYLWVSSTISVEKYAKTVFDGARLGWMGGGGGGGGFGGGFGATGDAVKQVLKLAGEAVPTYASVTPIGVPAAVEAALASTGGAVAGMAGVAQLQAPPGRAEAVEAYRGKAAVIQAPKEPPFMPPIVGEAVRGTPRRSMALLELEPPLLERVEEKIISIVTPVEKERYTPPMVVPAPVYEPTPRSIPKPSIVVSTPEATPIPPIAVPIPARRAIPAGRLDMPTPIQIAEPKPSVKTTPTISAPTPMPVPPAPMPVPGSIPSPFRLPRAPFPGAGGGRRMHGRRATQYWELLNWVPTAATMFRWLAGDAGRRGGKRRRWG